MQLLPVAEIRLMDGWCIRAVIASKVDSVRQVNRLFGDPALTGASAAIFTAATLHFLSSGAVISKSYCVFLKPAMP
jgi:hypothetical protein